MAQMREAYDSLIKKGALKKDAAQAAIAAKLDALCAALQEKRQEAGKSGFFQRFFGRSGPDYREVKSFYLYGKVGRGKTMMMDLFFAALPPGDKRRVHFNDFMNDVQNRLAAYRAAEKEGRIKLPAEGAFLKLADDLANEAHILCFDEFSVTDIADAMILSRLFGALFDRGVVLVATSNVAPRDLYQNGLNRALFLPFISLLEEKAEICALEAPTDYRLEQGDKADFPGLITPSNARARAQIDAFWRSITGKAGGEPQEITVRGHKISVPCAAEIQQQFRSQTARKKGKSGAGALAARFDFADIGCHNLSAFDYAALAEHYLLFCVENVPLFNEENRNEAKRFILFIDTLYDRHLPLCLSAAASADRLYAGKAALTEKFEFDRTASRLIEMQSKAYLQACLIKIPGR